MEKKDSHKTLGFITECWAQNLSVFVGHVDSRIYQNWGCCRFFVEKSYKETFFQRC